MGLYVAEYWVDHAQLESISSLLILSLLKRIPKLQYDHFNGYMIKAKQVTLLRRELE
jgi:hypothetical protein